MATKGQDRVVSVEYHSGKLQQLIDQMVELFEDPKTCIQRDFTASQYEAIKKYFPKQDDLDRSLDATMLGKRTVG